MRRFILLFLALTLFLGLLLAILALERIPTVNASSPADNTDAARTKAALVKLKHVLDADFGGGRYAISQAEMNSVLAVAARGLPFLRGSARIDSDNVTLALSARLPKPLNDLWLNLAVSTAISGGGFHVTSVKLGRVDLPAGLALSVLRRIAIIATGDDLVGMAIRGVKGVVVRGRTVSFDIALGPHERKALLTKSKRLLQVFSPLGNLEIVRLYYRALDRAAYGGRLPSQGSFFAYIRFALNLAERRARGGRAPQEIRSAILALAIYCGHWRAQYLVGEVITKDMKKRRSRCRNVTLAGRADLRKHFIISAALETASKSGIAFPIGEFKELLDSNRGGSGFSFEDLAADRAGIHFAARLLDSVYDKMALRALIAKIDSEAAIFPDISGLPESMSDVDFKRRFENIDSAKYQGVLAAIDQRIESLRFHR